MCLFPPRATFPVFGQGGANRRMIEMRLPRKIAILNNRELLDRGAIYGIPSPAI
jgi:hypothetical protein